MTKQTMTDEKPSDDVPPMIPPADSSHSERGDRPSRFRRVILWAGLACLLQFLVCAAIGVVRGYSIQSWAPLWIMLAGVVLVMPFARTRAMVSFLSSASLILFALVAISQGRHRDNGDELYEAGKFADAMMEYRKEIDDRFKQQARNFVEELQ